MNTAEQLTGPATETPVTLQVEIEASNIINLSEQGFFPASSGTDRYMGSFVDHIGSPLNEW